MTSKPKQNPPARSNDEIRKILLLYFYNRNSSATSARGKRGFSVKITDVRKALKASDSLSAQAVMCNLNYLLSQGWVEEDKVEKSVPLPSGTIIPNITSYYKISAVGIDKIEGPSEYTMDKFKGIKIEATGQNIITVGDGNQVNAQYKDAAKSLVDLKQTLLQETSLTEVQKLEAVADIDSIESQLAKPNPNRNVIGAAWEGIRDLEAIAGLTERVVKLAAFLSPFLSGS